MFTFVSFAVLNEVGVGNGWLPVEAGAGVEGAGVAALCWLLLLLLVFAGAAAGLAGRPTVAKTIRIPIMGARTMTAITEMIPLAVRPGLPSALILVGIMGCWPCGTGATMPGTFWGTLVGQGGVPAGR